MQLIVVAAPDIIEPTPEHNYSFVEALVNIACPGYLFEAFVHDVSLTICQFFYSLDVDPDLGSPTSVSKILETRAAYDEYLEASGFLQDKYDDIRGDFIEMIFLMFSTGKQDTLPNH
jgi:hypothetical protein